MAAYDIRMMKLVSGEIVLGKYDAEKDQLTDVAQLQNVPTQQGMQMLITPYGFPFENKFHAVMEGRFILYRFSDTPKELQDKYIEVTTGLTGNGVTEVTSGLSAGQQLRRMRAVFIHAHGLQRRIHAPPDLIARNAEIFRRKRSRQDSLRRHRRLHLRFRPHQLAAHQ